MPISPRVAPRILMMLALAATSATCATSATSADEESSSPEQVTMDRLRVIAAALQSFVNDATSGENRLAGATSDWVLASQASRLIRIPSESELLTYRELFDLFHPLGPREDASYLPEIPEFDGWGKRIEVHYAEEKLLAARVFSVRSSGANGRFDGDVYEIGGFLPGSETDDIVIADKRFVRWPLGTPEADLAENRDSPHFFTSSPAAAARRPGAPLAGVQRSRRRSAMARISGFSTMRERAFSPATSSIARPRSSPRT